MNVVAFFSGNGIPATGLTPKIDVWEFNGTPVVVAQDMTEIAGGSYFYNFAGYVDSVDYVIRADGGATLFGNDRYQFTSNEIPINVAEISKEGSSVDDLHKLQGLDMANSITVTPASRVVGTISQTISGDGITSTTIQRN